MDGGMHEHCNITNYRWIRGRVDLALPSGAPVSCVISNQAMRRHPVASEIDGPLQMHQHANSCFGVLRGDGDDFVTDTMKFEIDARIADRQIADTERLSTAGQ